MRDFKSEQEVLDYYSKTKRQIVIFEGSVYDVSGYIDHHPGGSDLLEPYLGKCIDQPFEENNHSAQARLVFRDLERIGVISGGVADKTPNIKGLDGYTLQCGLKFDFSKGLYKQMVGTNLQWDDYIAFINEPKHLVNPVRDVLIFDNPILELFTKTPWYFIPIAWAYPFFYHVTSSPTLSWPEFAVYLVLGVFAWTFVEYFLHRFLFHSEDYWLPNHPFILAQHFMLHGIHHAFPMDRYRLVFPIILGYPIMYGIILTPVRGFVSPEIQGVLSAGIILGYIGYDLIHYFIHHSSPKDGYFKDLKKYHMQHHYRNGLAGFGVSSKFWDYVFLT